MQFEKDNDNNQFEKTIALLFRPGYDNAVSESPPMQPPLRPSFFFFRFCRQVKMHKLLSSMFHMQK